MKKHSVFSCLHFFVAAFPSSAEAYITKYDDAKGWWGDDVILAFVGRHPAQETVVLLNES